MKKTKSNTNERSITKNRDTEARISKFVEEYEDLGIFKMKPVTEGFIERLACELVVWADKETSIAINEFYRQKKIPSESFYRWKEKFPSLKRAHQYAKDAIEERKEVGGITRKYDAGFTLNSLAKNSTDMNWTEFMEWKAKIAKEKQESQVIEVRVKDIRSQRRSEEDDRQNKGEGVIDV